jgi:hypothetical protein
MGYDLVIKNGTLIDGLPGRLLRGPLACRP